MIGMMKVYERTGERRYADHVAKFVDHHLTKPVEDLLRVKVAKGRAGYCGYWSPGTAALYLYGATNEERHLRLARQVADYIVNTAERDPDGGLGHWRDSHQLWVDTLYMANPLLAGLGMMEGKPGYVDDAANQLIVFAKHLQDNETGLFDHMYDWQTKTRSEGLWGRGNGWVMMSLADTLEAMEPTHKDYASLKKVSERLASGLARYQTDSGLWRTVIDHEDSYLEVSVSMMACYGLLKLVRLGVLDASNRENALRAWRAVHKDRYVDKNSYWLVGGVSAGTSPHGVESYKTRPISVYSWGTGAYLMAGSEAHRLSDK
jgi:unsaturated rhamnogalacturonyl hydrolase